MSSFPKVDNRLVRIFLSVVSIQDILPHTRRCSLGAKHCPRIDAGQDPNNPHRLFMIQEQCVGIDGWRCPIHGLEFLKQLSEKQRVDAIAQVIQLDPVPYGSEPLLDWCVKFLLEQWHVQPGHVIPAAPAPILEPASMSSSPVIALPPLGRTRRTMSHDRRYQGWVTNLIPAGGSHHTPSRFHSSRASASVSVSTPVTTVANVYVYTKDGHHPKVVEVDANHQGTMTYVNLRHPDILKAFGLKPRARNLPDKIQVYDAYSGKWYHPAAVSLWLRLNSHESLIIKAPTITTTPGLEEYAAAMLAKPAQAGSDTLRGFLALSRTPADRRLPFSPVPPLTVMLADVPEHAIPMALTSSTILGGRAPALPILGSLPNASGSGTPASDQERGSKRQKLNDGSAEAPTADIMELSSDEDEVPSTSSMTVHMRSNARRKRCLQPAETRVMVAEPIQNTVLAQENEVIDISDDEEPPTLPTPREVIIISDDEGAPTLPAPREVIVISDDDEPTIHASSGGSAVGAASLSRGTAARPGVRRLGMSSIPLTPCQSFCVTRTYSDDGEDSGADSDDTLF